jgi:hypothetical protein
VRLVSNKTLRSGDVSWGAFGHSTTSDSGTHWVYNLRSHMSSIDNQIIATGHMCDVRWLHALRSGVLAVERGEASHLVHVTRCTARPVSKDNIMGGATALFRIQHTRKPYGWTFLYTCSTTWPEVIRRYM